MRNLLKKGWGLSYLRTPSKLCHKSCYAVRWLALQQHQWHALRIKVKRHAYSTMSQWSSCFDTGRTSFSEKLSLEWPVGYIQTYLEIIGKDPLPIHCFWMVRPNNEGNLRLKHVFADPFNHIRCHTYSWVCFPYNSPLLMTCNRILWEHFSNRPINSFRRSYVGFSQSHNSFLSILLQHFFCSIARHRPPNFRKRSWRIDSFSFKD